MNTKLFFANMQVKVSVNDIAGSTLSLVLFLFSVVFTVGGCNTVSPGESAQKPLAGIDGEDGVACWDLNTNGIRDEAEDRNGDGVVDVLDCQGPSGDPGESGDDGQKGATGPRGLACWDKNENGVGDEAEDIHRIRRDERIDNFTAETQRAQREIRKTILYNDSIPFCVGSAAWLLKMICSCRACSA